MAGLAWDGPHPVAARVGPHERRELPRGVVPFSAEHKDVSGAHCLLPWDDCFPRLSCFLYRPKDLEVLFGHGAGLVPKDIFPLCLWEAKEVGVKEILAARVHRSSRCRAPRGQALGAEVHVLRY